MKPDAPSVTIVTDTRGPGPDYAPGSEVGAFERFAAEHLILSTDQWAGKPLELYDAQRRFLSEALAYDDVGPIWQTIVNVAPRKQGKTTLLAGYAVWRLLTSEGSPEILLAASSDKQAGRLFEAAATFVRRSPELSRRASCRDYFGEILREDGLGIIRRVSSDPKRLHGYSPSLVIIDELGQFTNPALERAFEALVSGGMARSRPQVFAITTPGTAADRHDSILGRMVDAAEATEDAEREPGLLVARMPEDRALAWIYEAPTTDPREIDKMLLANPAPWVTQEKLEVAVADPSISDSAKLQLYGAVWAEHEDAWLPEGAFAAREAKREVEGRVVLGFDGSYKHDATALWGCTVEHGHLFRLALWERPEFAPDDWRVPRDDVDAAVAEAMAGFDVVELACDPPGWHREIEEWREAYGEKLVLDFPTNNASRMVPALDEFRSAVLDGGLTHDGDPDLIRHVANAITKETRSGVQLAKPHPDRKIDAAVAAVVAYHRATWHRNNNKPRGVMMDFI